jgi:hypothetical protein
MKSSMLGSCLVLVLLFVAQPANAAYGIDLDEMYDSGH